MIATLLFLILLAAAIVLAYLILNTEEISWPKTTILLVASVGSGTIVKWLLTPHIADLTARICAMLTVSLVAVTLLAWFRKQNPTYRATLGIDRVNETDYLLQDPENARRLQDSVDRLEGKHEGETK